MLIFRYKRDVLYNAISSWQLPYAGNDSTLPQYVDTNDGGYILFCIIFILLGYSGIVLNSRALYSFFVIHRVSIHLNMLLPANGGNIMCHRL